MEIIAFTNQKGGVSKTTSTVNMGSIMAEQGKRVLLIDLDAQGNLTQILGITKYNHTIYDCLVNKVPLKDSIIHTTFNIDVVPSDINLSNAEIELLQHENKESVLKKIIEEANLNYDYILIDCNPSLNLLTINALVASDTFIIPLEASILSIYGLNQLLKIVKLVQKKLNPSLKNRGVFLTKVIRTNLTNQFMDQLREIFGSKLFDTQIHQNVEIMKAQIEGKPINYFNKNCRGYKDYLSLTLEVLEHGK